MGLTIGASRRVITPPLGTHLAGYYQVRAATAVHDDLYARALVVDDSTTAAAIVTCDLISLREESVVQARQLVQRATGLPGRNVLICCTHTHTGPVTRGGNRVGAFGQVNESYMAELEKQIASAVIHAWETRLPGTLRIGKSQETTIAFNRRYFMKDGSVRTNPGRGNPDIVRPAGPIDPDVYVLVAESAGGDPLAVLVNYALHADTTGGSAISADYPGWMEKHLKNMSPELDEAVVLYANGFCGDINHINVNDPHQLKGFAESERIGQQLAKSATAALANLESVQGERVRTASRVVPLPAVVPTADEVTWARQAVAATPVGGGPGREDLVRAHRNIILAELKKEFFDAEVQVISIGNVAVTGLPGEIFVELGLEIKRRSPFSHTILAELANGNVGYVCTEKAYVEGGYEPTSSRVHSGSGETLVRTALDLLHQLHGAA